MHMDLKPIHNLTLMNTVSFLESFSLSVEAFNRKVNYKNDK